MSPPRWLLAVVTAAALAACGTPSTPDPEARSPGSPTTPDPVSPAATGSGAAAAPSGPASSGAIADEPPALALEEVASGLSSPIGIEAAPGGWLLVNERDGRVVAVPVAGGEPVVALDLTDRVLGGGEQGLLGLALHPEWPEVGRAFVHYTDRNGDTVVSEFAAAESDGGAPALDPASERVLLQVDQPYANHNGGQLAFGPDRMLYLGLGDGGSGADPHGHGQNTATLLGSILRLDVSESGRYRIPADNPFADGAAGAPEIHLYGLRNPWRFSFDRATGLLWIADVGQNAYEEIDRVDPVADAGANLGWALMEASHCFADPGCSSDGLVLPVSEYGRDQGCSVTGGHVYRGAAIPDLVGWYLFSDYCTGLIFGLRSDVTEVTAPRVLLETGTSVAAFGQDADGELFLADIEGGVVYRVVPAG